MNQTEWITALRQALRGLPREDVERSVGFYEEAIQDRMEEGCTEEEAVAAIGTPRDIADQILAEIPLTKLVRKKVAPTRAFRPWEIILLILGAPLWLPLLLAAVSVFLAIYIALWAVILSLYAVDLSVAACGIVGIVGTFLYGYLSGGHIAGSLLFLGAGLLCSGIALFLFFGFNQAARGILLLSKQFMLCIKELFKKKEEAA